MRPFLAAAAVCTFALLVLALYPIQSEGSGQHPGELLVFRPSPTPQHVSGVASGLALSPARLTEALKKRAARDCFGLPAEALVRKLNPSGAASRRSVTGASQSSPVTLRALVLRVDFLSDRTGSQTSTEGGGFDLRRGTTSFIDPPPHNRDYFTAHVLAMSKYYAAMSDSQILIQYSVFPLSPDSAFHLSDMADYGPWTYGEGDYELAVKLITDAIRAADDSSEPIVFSEYDMVYIYHAGADLQGDINGDSPNDIPSFTAGLAEPLPVDGGTSHVYAATVLPETVSQDGLTGAVNGVTVHETGHLLGLPDLYNTDDFLPSVGYWSLMDTGNYLSGYVLDPNSQQYVYVFGLLPGSLDAYCRRELGRLYGVETVEQIPVSQLWADTLRAVESFYKVLNVPVNASEYFLIENRQSELDGNGEIRVTADPGTGVILGPDSNEYDALLPGSGVLIWHVDDNMIASRAAQGMGPNGSWPDRGVSLEEADGIEDLGDPASDYWLGSEFDPYFAGNATMFTPSTTPNSDANSGTVSQVYADVTSPRAVGMYVSVDRKWAKPGWPVAAAKLAGSVPGFGDFDSDGVSEVFVAGRDSTVRAWTSDGATYLPGQSNGYFARAAGSLMPAVCYVPATSVLVATASVSGEGKLYAWAVNNDHSPVLPGQTLPGWPSAYMPSVTTSPCAIGDKVYVGCSDGGIYSVDASGRVDRRTYAVTERPVTGSIAAGDADRDGENEIAFSSRFSSGTTRAIFCVSAVTGNFEFFPYVLPAEAAAPDTVGPFLLMADVDGKPDSTLEVVAVLQSGLAFALDATGQPLDGWPVTLGDTVVTWPSAGDVDGDGLAELVVHSAGGRVYVVNGSGVVSSGWPFESGGRADSLWKAAGGDPRNAVSLANTDSDPAAELVFTLHDSELTSLTGSGGHGEGWPVSTGVPVSGCTGLVDLESDGSTELFVPLADSLIWCFELPSSAAGLQWPVLGGSSQRTNCLEKAGGFTASAGGGLILGGRIYAQPNPARGASTSIRFSLGSAATVAVEMFDLSGRKVFSSRGEGFQSENSVIWPLDGVASGVYVVRVEAEAGGRKDVAFCRASVIH